MDIPKPMTPDFTRLMSMPVPIGMVVAMQMGIPMAIAMAITMALLCHMVYVYNARL